MFGRIRWLGMERFEGDVGEAGIPVPEVTGPGVRAFMVPLPGVLGEKRGKQNRAEGREAGREIREVRMTAAKAVSSVSATTKQETDIRSRWAWVEAVVWTERMLAALENGVKGDRWFSLMDKAYAMGTLERAFERVAGKSGSHGVDRMSVELFAGNKDRYLAELQEVLKSGTYQPLPVRRIYIPKPDGRRRPLGIPTVKDRVVQAALKMVLEPIFEREFVAHSYGFRPGRGCKDALRTVDGHLKEGWVWVVDADFKGYFDAIPHERLMDEIRARISDGQVLALVERYLRQDVMDGLDRWTPTQGTPQGAVLSPLLANVYLHHLDLEMERRGHRMVRYADDFVVFCGSEQAAQEVLGQVSVWAEAHGLELHPKKTRIANWLVPGQGFEFLGYRFDGGGRTVRRSSLMAFKDKVRERTRRTEGKSMSDIIDALNPMVRGWFNYFKHADHRLFPALDSFIRRRLRSILCKQNGISYVFNRSLRNHQRWPNVFFAELGLFTMKEAWLRAS